jgi:serine/threonine protein kinase/DNA-binding CsgD family transcriptional regulator
MIGTKLNQRYEILDLLGEGATSTVYKGKDTLLGREVALKVLHPHVRDTTRERFFQEAMAAAQLNHPNIMAIHDRGVDNGRDYLVVEYVQGDPLTHYIPSVPETVVVLGIQIARALHYAHERDIIHRDIKPANIMVTPEGQVKIMDLGLALPREAKRVTAPGMVIGTPAYISPEQAKGKTLDRRTDIYSLGIVLYEMSSGELPFNADDITALLLQHVQQAPPPPRLITPELPIPLESIVLKCLEKDRARRFQTCRALADALQAVFSRDQIQIPPAFGEDTKPPAPPMNPNENIAEAEEEPRRRRTGPVIRVVLADDHALLRRMLVSYLQSNEDIIIVGEASDGDIALEQTLANKPDLLLLDLNMPSRGGLEILPEIRKQAPDVKVLVLTGRDDDHYIMRALRSGAHGYVLKTSDEANLLDSIRKVMAGEMVLGRGIAEKVVTGLLGNDASRLSEKELDVLRCVAAGMDDEAISARLKLGMTELIEIHARVLDKVGARDRSSAALKALRSGLILIEDLQDMM